VLTVCYAVIKNSCDVLVKVTFEPILKRCMQDIDAYVWLR